jgi:hypothetical protein
MNGTYFIECVLQPLAELCYPEGRKTHERRIIVHFDNALIHSTQEVRERLAQLGFKRMEHPRYLLDLAPCDFFLFGVRKKHLSGQRFDGLGELSLAMERFLGGLSADILQTIHQEWLRQLGLFCESGGEYME